MPASTEDPPVAYTPEDLERFRANRDAALERLCKAQEPARGPFDLERVLSVAARICAVLLVICVAVLIAALTVPRGHGAPTPRPAAATTTSPDPAATPYTPTPAGLDPKEDRR